MQRQGELMSTEEIAISWGGRGRMIYSEYTTNHKQPDLERITLFTNILGETKQNNNNCIAQLRSN